MKRCNLKERPLVFISYGHKDEEWRDRLVEHLSVLEQNFIMDLWYDKHIGIGKEWLKEIKDALARSHAAVLLISSSFLSSEFIKHKEIPPMLARRDGGFRVFPVLVRPCAWSTVQWLKNLQIRPANGVALSSGTEHDIDAHLTRITLEIYEILKRRTQSNTQNDLAEDEQDK